MATPPNQKVTPLDWRTAIVDPKTGAPNNYFIRLWQTMFGNGEGSDAKIATLETEVAALEAAQIQAGTGIDVTPDGKLLDNPTITLADTAVTPGTYGDATNVGQFTVDQQGRVTAATNVAISGGGGGGASGATAVRTTNQNISNFTDVVVTLDSTTHDDAGYFDVAHPTRMTAITTGWYAVQFTALWSSNTTGYKSAWFKLNGGSTQYGMSTTTASSSNGTPVPNANTLIYLTANDYLEVYVRQGGSGTLTLTANTIFFNFVKL